MYNSVFVLFPIDLYDDTSYIEQSKVFLVEEKHYFNRADKKSSGYVFNILKPIYHRATMRSYYDFLSSKKINCTYIDLNTDWTKIVSNYTKKRKFKLKLKLKLKFFDPVDRFIEKKIRRNFDEFDMINTPRFILTTEEMEVYNGVLRQTSFYIWIRNLKSILLDKNDKPVGGKISYDQENRKKPYDGIENDVDDKVDNTDDPYVKEAFNYIKKNINESDFKLWSSTKEDVKNISSLSKTELKLKFPIDRKGSVKRLYYFVKNNLHRFGSYQDVLLDDSDNSFVFHSGLSPMINIGLITPFEILNVVIAYYQNLSPHNKKVYINNVEGFVRQILGWREFTRYMYQHHSNEYLRKNFFGHTKRLSSSWYDGTIGIHPIDVCISKAFRFGYLHHIERLMVVANYMLLTGISPTQMYKWFMEFSLDSYDWVMEYNVFCMASFSSGSKFISKPYISSSRYLWSMGNYDSTKKKITNGKINGTIFFGNF